VIAGLKEDPSTPTLSPYAASAGPNKGLLPVLFDTMGIALLPELTAAAAAPKNAVADDDIDSLHDGDVFDPLPLNVGGRWTPAYNMDSQSQSQSQSDSWLSSSINSSSLAKKPSLADTVKTKVESSLLDHHDEDIDAAALHRQNSNLSEAMTMGISTGGTYIDFDVDDVQQKGSNTLLLKYRFFVQ